MKPIYHEMQGKRLTASDILVMPHTINLSRFFLNQAPAHSTTFPTLRAWWDDLLTKED